MLVAEQLGLRVVLPVEQAVDRVALRVKKLGEESPVLAGDPGDERGGHPGEVTELRIGTVDAAAGVMPLSREGRIGTLSPACLFDRRLAHRNLLYLLSLKELRTRYKKSILGWAWSLLNPLTQMVIFSIIFLRCSSKPPPIGDPSGLKNFPLYFLCGLLPFNFFSISVGVSMGTVQGGAGLIKKVQFPHEHLVFSVVVAQFVTLLIEFVVLIGRAADRRQHGAAVDTGPAA